MKLESRYSYEFNSILNPNFNEKQQIQNFASLLSDKDRFLNFLPILQNNSKTIEKYLGTKLKEHITFYVVRAEQFKSFSEPITIEYSLCPEEMILFLLKEIIKISLGDLRFPDDVSREQHINSFIDFMLIEGEWGKADFVKFGKNLHEESKQLFPEYKFKDSDFSKLNLKEHIENLYS